MIPLQQALFDRSHPPNARGCRLWKAGIKTKGYGGMRWNGKYQRSNRLALEARLGRPIKPGYQALHTCNARACVTPSHLYEGTPADNMRDRQAAGGYIGVTQGEKNPASKLTAKKVRYIKRSSLMGIELAAMFGVTPAAISAVRRGKNWPHIK